MQDKILIYQMKKGDISAFEKIIDKYNRYVATICINILGGVLSFEDIQEVINEVFFLLWKNREKINMEKYENVKSYLAAIARNEAKDKLKYVKKEMPIEEKTLCISNNQIEEYHLKEWIISAIYELRREERIVLVKYYYQGKSIKEIAFEENFPESTVKTHMRRGKERLKSLLEREGILWK